MSPRQATAAREEALRTRRVSDRLLDRQGILPVRDTYERESDKLMKHLRQVFAGLMLMKMLPEHTKRLKAFLFGSSFELGTAVGLTLTSTTRTTLQVSLESGAQYLARLRNAPSPADDPVVAAKILRRFEPGLVVARKEASEAVGQSIAEKLAETAAAEASKGSTVAETLEGVESTLGKEWWKIERATRTETSRVFNTMQDAVIQEASRDLPGLYTRWTELVDDYSRKPLDNRVGNDSIVLHGQVVRPGREFTMPDSPLAPTQMVGQTWPYPPNRPNDRAVITPWMAEWGIPSWIYRAGQVVPL